MQIDEKALVRAVKRAMEHAGTMPAKDAVKLVPADWHRICDLVLKSAKQKGEAEGWVLVPRDLVERAQHALSASEFGDDRCVAAEISAMLSAGGEG